MSYILSSDAMRHMRSLLKVEKTDAGHSPPPIHTAMDSERFGRTVRKGDGRSLGLIDTALANPDALVKAELNLTAEQLRRRRIAQWFRGEFSAMAEGASSEEELWRLAEAAFALQPADGKREILGNTAGFDTGGASKTVAKADPPLIDSAHPSTLRSVAVAKAEPQERRTVHKAEASYSWSPEIAAAIRRIHFKSHRPTQDLGVVKVDGRSIVTRKKLDDGRVQIKKIEGD
jgi:hypothetical protein